MSPRVPAGQSPKVRCREIGSDDAAPIARLLAGGFGDRDPEFWMRALDRLSEHATPPGFPKFGYMLENDGVPVGAILLIFTSIENNGTTGIRCGISSWYVAPDFRGYAALLAARALKHRDVTYINVTAAPHTWPILEAQGYRSFSQGQAIAIPSLSLAGAGTGVTSFSPNRGFDKPLSCAETDLLSAHQRAGCLSVVCEAEDGTYPFVFIPMKDCNLATVARTACSYVRRRVLRKHSEDGAARPALLGLPFAYLIYCRAIEDFSRFAGPLGRFLARRGLPLVVVDANGPITGLVGWHSVGSPKFYKGPHRPRCGDLAYTEWGILGIEPLGRGRVQP